MVIGCAFSMNVKLFKCVEVSTFLMVIQYLHGVVDGIEGMCVIIEMLCKSGRVAITTERVLVFVVSYCKISSSTCSVLRATLPELHNMSMITHIPSIPLTTPCKYYITIRKVLTLTHLNGFTFMLKAQPITI